MSADGSEHHPLHVFQAKGTLARSVLLRGLEKRSLAIILTHAVAIGLFTLVVPLTVQELVNTFAYSIQPIMIVTLAGTVLVGLLFMGAFRVLQARAVKILLQRLFTRIALAMIEHLPRFREEAFSPRYASYFMEAELFPRAVVAMLADIVNALISGTLDAHSRHVSPLFPRL